MSRRRKAVKRKVQPDPIYKDVVIAKFINCLMLSGKKSVAERIVYSALNIASKELNKSPLEVFSDALQNVKPVVEVRSRRVGGATYQIPIEIRFDRAQALAIRWIIDKSRKRTERTMKARLAHELLDASQNRGSSVKKREDTHRMAEANKAFSHYRW